MPDNVLDQLQKARERLLDLTLNNRLLNYRPPKAASVRIVDELIPQIWRILIENEAQMEFLAREEHEFSRHSAVPVASTTPEDDEAANTLFALPEMNGKEQPSSRRYTDRNLQTAHEGPHLQTRLLRLYQLAQSAMEELGVNVLFLGLGFLSWRPPDRQESVIAPLFLVPVTLERASAKHRFKLSTNGDDPVLNPCLIQKLKRDYRIEIPGEPEDWTDFDVQGYMQTVRDKIKQQPDWSVNDDMYLGIFSFTKYLMFLDLAADRWPKESALTDNALVRALCGDRQAIPSQSAIIPRPEDLDKTEDLTAVYQVVDADSSQQAAIAAVKAGTTLVIQGPPGTGKSQTITNLIAETMAMGKTVLFVSQKKAALEVVQSRLERVGLGDFCLELHSTKAHRATMLAEMERVLATASTPSPSTFHKIERLKQLKDRLNGYVKTLHEPFGTAGLTPYHIMGRHALLREIPQVIATIKGCETWTRQEYETLLDSIKSLARHVESVWPPQEQVWHGCRLSTFTLQLRLQATDALSQLLAQLQHVNRLATALTAILNISEPQTLHILNKLLVLAKFVLEAPVVSTELLTDKCWDNFPPEIKKLLMLCKDYGENKSAMAQHYDITLAEKSDWQPVLQRLQNHIGPDRWFFPQYWRDRARLKRTWKSGYSPGIHQRLQDLLNLMRLQDQRRQIEAQHDLGEKFFGAHWQGATGAAETLVKLATWLHHARGLIRQGVLSPQAQLLCLENADREPLRQALGQVELAIKDFEQQLTGFCDLLRLQEPGWLKGPIKECPLLDLGKRLTDMQAQLEGLVTWTQYQEILQSVEQSPLAAFVAQADRQGLEPELYALTFEKQYLSLLLEAAFAVRDPLRTFNGRIHEDSTLEFARLDGELMQANRHRLYEKVAAMRPMNGFAAAQSSQLGIIQGEIRRKRGGRTIRRILRDAGEVVQRLKPCFMMSPLSVAQYLAPEGLRFDLVVFDEASQVEPADALGAVARGKQLVLVGDRKQLPPTSFFSAINNDEPGDADSAAEAGITDMESILDRGEAVFPPLPLRWHYRSRHESLIMFSNAEFYNNELIVFPSCHTSRDELGVSLRYESADLYDRGKSRTNRGQAKRIATAVFEHYRKSPGKSLAVGAFSVAQQQAILDEIEGLRRQDDSLEEYFKPARSEPFFVKNLETIQGDERDVIFLSVGHGRSVAGERVGGSISNLNGDEGWRRLNVLITRARERYVVFSSILGGDMDLSGTTARGVHSFKRYLEFSQSGQLPTVAVHDGEFQSPFEEAVYNALNEHGVQLHRQVGCVGYAIDLAVVDPDHPGRYLMGIECDGATYHGSATARDRDRLRQQVLESLGWRIHRIWSTDWFMKPKTEIERTIEAIQKAKTGQLKPRFVDLSSAINAPTIVPTHQQDSDDTDTVVPPVPTEPYRVFDTNSVNTTDDFYTSAITGMADLVYKIVLTEGPIHTDELQKRVAAQYGIGRIGNRVEERITRAIDQAASNGRIKLRDRFAWPNGMAQPPLRRRTDPFNKNIDWVVAEEMVLAAQALVKLQFGINRVDLVTQVARVLGFSPSGARTKTRIDEVIASGIHSGLLSVEQA